MIVIRICFKFLTLVLGIFFFAIITNADHAEECRTEISRTDRGGNYIYYERASMFSPTRSLKRKEASEMVSKLYENAFLNNKDFINPYVIDSNSIQVLQEYISQKKADFCKEEINELNEIHEGTTKTKEYFVESTSGNCLSLLEAGFCSQDYEVPVEKVLSFDNLIRELEQEEIYSETFGRIFDVWNGGDLSAVPEAGWKLHVGLNQDEPVTVIIHVLEFLRKNNIHHKVARSQEVIERLNSDNTQRGKIITIYPKDEEELISITRRIDKLLSKFSSNYILPPFDAKIGTSGGITSRYGALNTDKKVIKIVDRDGKYLGEEYDQRGPNNPILPESLQRKNLYAPNLVTWNPFEEAGIYFEAPPPTGWQ